MAETKGKLGGLSRTSWRRGVVLTGAVLLCLAISDAHEGDEALSNRGVHLENNSVLLDGRAWQALAPQLARVERRTLRRTVLATGQLTVPPNARAYASTWLPGRVEKVLVELGQSVQAGEVIAWIRSAEWEKLLAEYSVAQNEAAAARLEWQRVNGLYRESLASQQEWIEAQARLREKENALLVSRLQVQALAEGAPTPGALLPVRSPIAGRVTRWLTHLGQEAEPRRPLVEIVDARQLWFQAKVPQFYSAQVQIGQSAEVRLRAFPQAGPFPARVFARSRVIDPQSQTETIWLELLDRPALSWQVGMQGTAQIEIARRENVLAIPSAAMVQEGMESYVFVARDPAACCHDAECQEDAHALDWEPQVAYERVSVTPGLTTPDWVEVREGLREGDLVVTVGRHQLAALVPPIGGGEFRVSPQAWQRYAVRVEPASFQSVRDTITLQASVTALPSRRRELQWPLAGMLERWHLVTPGPVRQGQILAELTSWELQQWQLAWLQAELSAQTQQSLVNAYRQLVAQGVPLPDPVLRNAELALQSARTLASSWKSRLSQLAGLSEAQLQALLQQHQLVSRVALTAPQEGWAVPAELAVGQFLTPDQALAEILPSSVPQIRARVPEPLWNEIRQASAGRFRPAWVGWPVWSARLFYLEEIQTADQQRFVWAQLQDAPENLPLNLRGSLTVDINGSQAAVLAVPATALWREGNQWAVFVYHRDRDTFEYRPVVVGKVNDQWAEIRTGLQPGEEVAVTCVPDLRRHYGRLRSATDIYSGHCED